MLAEHPERLPRTIDARRIDLSCLIAQVGRAPSRMLVPRLDLFDESLRAAVGAKPDSDLYDDRLLDTFVFSQGIQKIHVYGLERLIVDEPLRAVMNRESLSCSTRTCCFTSCAATRSARIDWMFGLRARAEKPLISIVNGR